MITFDKVQFGRKIYQVLLSFIDLWILLSQHVAAVLYVWFSLFESISNTTSTYRLNRNIEKYYIHSHPSSE